MVLWHWVSHISIHIYIYILVGGFNPSEKYYSWDDYSQYMEKMFQTTNQYMYPII